MCPAEDDLSQCHKHMQEKVNSMKGHYQHPTDPDKEHYDKRMDEERGEHEKLCREVIGVRVDVLKDDEGREDVNIRIVCSLLLFLHTIIRLS